MIERAGRRRTEQRGRRGQWGAGALAVALLVASCTSSSGVTQENSTKSDGGSVPTSSSADTDPPSTQPTDPGAPATTAAPGAAATQAPDAEGLPSLGDIDSDIVRGTLDNGLQYFIRNNGQPGGRVSMRLAIDAGAGLQDDDQGGGAHFLEHMLFNGTEDFPENELVAVLRSFGAAFGADVNAYTSNDETVYQLTMPTADASVVTTGLDVLEQWMTSATIDQAQVEAERGIVLDEWRVRDQSSNGRLFDQIADLFLQVLDTRIAARAAPTPRSRRRMQTSFDGSTTTGTGRTTQPSSSLVRSTPATSSNRSSSGSTASPPVGARQTDPR